jgi:radical SAM superfamily enzyme YgiQ (UPF0313 family)
MNIVLINPCFNRYAGLKGHGGLSAPLNLACLAAYIRQRRPQDQVSIIDAEALDYSYDDILREIFSRKPSLIGITTTTPGFGIICELVSKINNAMPDMPIILGGPHATGSPETTAAIPGVTVAVIGEGEVTFLEIINNLEQKLPINTIKGIAYRDSKEKVIKTESRDLIENLDILPLPARDLLPMELYYSPPTKSLGGSRIANIVSSRGCLFHCTYCLSDMMWKGKYRQRSVDKIIEEIEDCVNKYGSDEINFNDDLFTADKKRLEEFCNKVIEKKMAIRWIAMSRADYINDDLLKIMKKAGCCKIAMGLESGSQQVLKCMNKNLNLDKSIEAVRKIKKAGISVGVSFVMGHIGETEATIKETIAFAKKINPDTIAFFQASPYPGTDFYRMAKESGYIRKDAQWIDYAIVSDRPSVVNLPGLSADTIHKWVKYAYKSFYLNLRYILSRLIKMKSPKVFMDNLKGLKILYSIIKK